MWQTRGDEKLMKRVHGQREVREWVAGGRGSREAGEVWRNGGGHGMREQAGEGVLSEKVVRSCAHAARAK